MLGASGRRAVAARGGSPAFSGVQAQVLQVFVLGLVPLRQGPAAARHRPLSSLVFVARLLLLLLGGYDVTAIDLGLRGPFSLVVSRVVTLVVGEAGVAHSDVSGV